MLTRIKLLVILDRLIREFKRRHIEIVVDKIIERKSKYVVLARIMDRNLKIIICKNNVKVRAYSGLTGMDIAVRRVLIREYNKVLRMRSDEEESL